MTHVSNFPAPLPPLVHIPIRIIRIAIPIRERSHRMLVACVAVSIVHPSLARQVAGRCVVAVALWTVVPLLPPLAITFNRSHTTAFLRARHSRISRMGLTRYS